MANTAIIVAALAVVVSFSQSTLLYATDTPNSAPPPPLDPEALARRALARLANATVERLDSLNGGFFDNGARLLDQLASADCHLRNLDLCYAGLLGSFGKHALPETNDELDVRCDEMRSASQCATSYAARCSSDRALSLLAPFSAQNTLDTKTSMDDEQRSESAAAAAADQLMDSVDAELRLDERVEQLLSNDSLAEAWQMLAELNATLATQLSALDVGEMSRLCSPKARNSNRNKLLRHKLFKLAKCVNERMPSVMPCVDDLKNAVQIIYELNSRLEMSSTCCAFARFRQCAVSAFENVCQLGSMRQFETSLSLMAGRASPAGALSSLMRACRAGSSPESEFCKSVVPPSGTRAPLRRGRKASRVAKLLDMVKFSPPQP